MALARTRSVVGPALLLAVGCATAGERPRARAPLPIEERSPADAAAFAGSGSTAALGTATVSIGLATVLELAGAQPNAIRLAREKLAEADARVDASAASLLPTVVLGGSFQRHNGTIQDVGGAFEQTTRQAIFLGGTGEVVLDVGEACWAFCATASGATPREPTSTR